MTPGSRVEQSAELRIYGATDGPDFDPDELTTRLGVVPHSIRRRGEPGRNGRVARCSSWQWSTPQRIEFDSEVLVREVLDTFDPADTELARVRTTWGLELVLGLVVHMYGAAVTDEGESWTEIPTPGLALSLETLQRLTRRGCDLDIDQYVHAPRDA
jgi:hypothetical protein